MPSGRSSILRTPLAITTPTSAAEVGLTLDPQELDARVLFRLGKNAAHALPSTARAKTMIKAGGANWSILSSTKSRHSLSEFDRDNFFEIAYEHFAEAGVWELYPEVLDVLEQLQPRFQLGVVSNFDGRLRMILEQLGISKFFSHVFVSSELGADKPDPEIFRRALKFIDLSPTRSSMSATIPNATGKQRAPPVCRSFDWIDQRIRCAIC